MEWSKIHYFITVAQLQNITRAADVLSISQPALSKSIVKLEEEFGAPLFDRIGKHIVLNRFGKIFLEYSERAMQEITEGKKVVQNMLDPASGQLTFGFLKALGYYYVPKVIRMFGTDNPKVHFDCYSGVAGTLLDGLLNGEIDLILSSPIISNNDEIEWIHLFNEECVLILSDQHRLAGRHEIQIEELANDPFIGFSKSCALRKISDDLFAENRINPPMVLESYDFFTIVGMVKANLGFSIINQSPALDSSLISFVKIADHVCQRPIGVACRKNRYLSPVVTKFKNFLIRSSLSYGISSNGYHTF